MHRGHAVLVLNQGEVVFEAYHNAYQAQEPHVLASGTKSFNGVMAVAAVQDGLLSLDERVSETIREWLSDPRKSRITIRQLLSLESGLEAGEIGRVPTYAQAVAQPTFAEPGTQFKYGPAPFQVFGELMRRKLQARNLTPDPLEYLTRRVLAPIGLNIGSWRRGADGQPNLPSGAFLTAREWAKFGWLIAQGGTWNGQVVLRPNLLKACFQPAVSNPAYGLTWWLGQAGDDGTTNSRNPNTPDDLVLAAGAGKQRLYVISSLKLVVVRFGQSGGNFEDSEFLERLLGMKR
jgi:CubicO group peptidase (beta-lactamase class C family)